MTKTKKAAHPPGPWPLKVLPGDSYKLTLITAQGNHYATTFDPSAAHLIAAAPDLLEAARAGLDTLVALGKENWGAVERLRAAIAKADGLTK